jgi:PAS domain S-box-containing protein
MAGGILDGLTNLPPASIWGNLIFCIICTIAIVKYHLLDIRVVVRKSLAYLLISLLIAAPYVGVLYLLHYIFEPILGPWWVHAVLILLLAIFLRPLYSWAQKIVDRLFYRERYDYLKALEQFSQKTQSVMNLKELCSTLTGLVSGALRTSDAYLLLPSENDDGFIVTSAARSGNLPSGIVLKNNSLLIKWLEFHQSILSSDEFNIVPQLQSLSLEEKNDLRQMEAKLFVPIQTGPGQLSGILVLSNKLSHQHYSSEDRQLLSALSSQMAMALENARLYNESWREVNERKRAEQELQAEKNKLSSIIYALEDFLTIMDTDYNLIFQNELSKQLFGNRIGEKCYLVFENQGNVCEGCPVEKAFRYSNSHTAERRAITLAGEVIFLENTASLIRDARGEVIGCLEIARDITERKKAEAREKELQRELYLSSRLASIGELAAGVAHQLNNPLTGVIGFSQRLMRKSTDLEVNKDLKRIYSEAERAAKIVQNLLTFARQRQPQKQYSDINKVLESALELRAYELKTANIELVTDLGPRLPKTMIDYHQIQEVFLNIILNAEQAMTASDGGGKLTIKTEKNKKYVRTIFTDSGPGIPSEQLDKIFDPFYTTKGEKGGTGLGLSICHGIITEHGGKIYAKSKPSKGTTFFVELPIKAEE